MIVALAGGVGGAKMAQGLALALPPGDLTVIVNTADDFDLYGLRICPDLDTVLYTLAGLADPVHGWGIAGDTTTTLQAIARYGRDPWFRLGDQDFATHILRTERLRAGLSLTDVVHEFTAALDIATTVLPMCDESVATLIDTPTGQLAFQDYFVARHQADDVIGVQFAGIDAARPTPAVLGAIASARLIILCPSNPIVSIGPILTVPGLRSAIVAAAAPVVAVSPIIAGRALKGPADKMLATLGHEVSAVGVAALYAGILDALVIDTADHDLAGQITDMGLATLVTATVMGDRDDRRRLAQEILAFGETTAASAGTPR